MIKLRFIIRYPIRYNMEIWHHSYIFGKFVASFYYYNNTLTRSDDSFPTRCIKFKNRFFKYA